LRFLGQSAQIGKYVPNWIDLHYGNLCCTWGNGEFSIWGHRGTIFLTGQALYAARMTDKEEPFGVGRDTRKINLRLPEELRDKITDASVANGRSVNTEILLRLAASVNNEEEGNARQLRTQLGLIEFLANSVSDLAARLTDDQRTDQRVQMMVELSKSLMGPATK